MHCPRSRERGVVLIFTLIILLILTIGGVALVRSMQSSLFSAGNLAFRRDLVNQGELASSQVVTAINASAFPGPGATDTTHDQVAYNYSATTLPTNTQGVPNVLLADDATFAGTFTAPDLTGATADVKIRYVIDRLCVAIPPTVLPTSALCVQSSSSPTGLTIPGNGLAPPRATVYRISVRVSGARSTQVFLQSTFTKLD